jgi:hypothetical protein
MSNKSYEAPSIVDHGDLTALTAQTTTGTRSDADLPAGTPLPVILQHLSG